MKRRGHDWSQSLTIVEPYISAIEMALRNRLRRQRKLSDFGLYSSLVNVEGSKRLTGVVFELLAQEKVQPTEPDYTWSC